MIRLLPLGRFSLKQGDTPESLRLKLLPCLGNFTWTIQETQTGRVIQPDEILVDGREYYASFVYDPPPQQRFHESLASKSKYERILPQN